jgi:hypothetical protein
VHDKDALGKLAAELDQIVPPAADAPADAPEDAGGDDEPV